MFKLSFQFLLDLSLLNLLRLIVVALHLLSSWKDRGHNNQPDIVLATGDHGSRGHNRSVANQHILVRRQLF